MPGEDRQQLVVADVAGRDDQQSPRRRSESVAVQSPSLVTRTRSSASAVSATARRAPSALPKVQCVKGIVPGRDERPRQPRRKLRVKEKLHPASGIRRFPTARAPYSSAARRDTLRVHAHNSGTHLSFEPRKTPEPASTVPNPGHRSRDLRARRRPALWAATPVLYRHGGAGRVDPGVVRVARCYERSCRPGRARPDPSFGRDPCCRDGRLERAASRSFSPSRAHIGRSY